MTTFVLSDQFILYLEENNSRIQYKKGDTKRLQEV